MSLEKAQKFIGRAIVLDPHTGEDSEFSAYVCLLLTGKDSKPAITVCEAPDIDALLRKLMADDLHAKFKDAKLTFDPPSGAYPINQSRRRQRYEALSLHELGRVQTVMSGR